MQKNFVIIGCGRIGLRHAEQIIRIANVKAVCDIVHAKADALATFCKATAYYCIEDMLAAEPALDVMSICTPNGLHAAHSIKALQAGLHVLCEKPLCLTVQEGEKMIAVARKKK